MKKIALDFIRRGLVSCWIGPVVLAIIYFILYKQGIIKVLDVPEVCTGILTLSLLAFISGGINVIYTIERLPLLNAILIHGAVLYFGYLGTYIVNEWIECQFNTIAIFTTAFLLGYILIWTMIYYIRKRNTVKLNKQLKKKQEIKKG